MTAWIFSAGYCTCAVVQDQTEKAPSKSSGKQTRQRVSRGGRKALKATAEVHGQEELDANGFPLLGSRYQITNAVGFGGMGAIYQVREKELETPLAVKLLREEFAADTISISRLKKEALTASSLSHPNIIQVFGYSTTPQGRPFLVMEYVDGLSLEQLIENEERLDWQRALNLLLQLCEGLSYAHNRGVIHRDLKPSNILITRNQKGLECAKILDLGISKQLSADGTTDSTKLTQTGDVIGSPLYMSPEQCQGEDVDTRSDVYSLGCLTYEMLTGEPAFQAENAVKVILNHLNVDRKVLLNNLESCSTPSTLAKLIVEGCLSVDKENRIPSVQVLSRNLWSIANQTKTNIWKPSRPPIITLRRATITGGVIAAIGLVAFAGASIKDYLEPNKASPPVSKSGSPSKTAKKSVKSAAAGYVETAKKEMPPPKKQAPEKISSKPVSKQISKQNPKQNSAPVKAPSPKPVETKAPTAKVASTKPTPKAPPNQEPRQTVQTQRPAQSPTRTQRPVRVAAATTGQGTVRNYNIGPDKKELALLRRLQRRFPRQFVRINFDTLDRDRNGYISSSETGYIWRWLNSYDINGDTYISRQEVRSLSSRQDKRHIALGKRWIKANFPILDRNRDKRLTATEAPFLWQWMKKQDLNRDGAISLVEVLGN